jgi:hypothetical protein
MVAQSSKTKSELWPAGRHCSSLSGRDHFSGVETETSQHSPRSSWPALKPRTQRARRILDDVGIMARSHVQNRRHIRHPAERVHRQDGLYPPERPHCLGETLRVHVEGVLIYVDEQRLRPAQPDRIGGRRPGVRRNGHQVTGADA